MKNKKNFASGTVLAIIFGLIVGLRVAFDLGPDFGILAFIVIGFNFWIFFELANALKNDNNLGFAISCFVTILGAVFLATIKSDPDPLLIFVPPIIGLVAGFIK